MNHFQQKIIITIISILTVFAGIIVFIIYPSVKEISTIKREIIQEKIELEQKLALGLNLKEISRKLEAIKNSLSQLDKIFIAEGAELEFVSQLENIAQKEEIILNIESDFQGEKIADHLKAVNLEINWLGNYRQSIGFLRRLEIFPGYYNPKILIFSKKNAPEGNLNVQLLGKIYLQTKE